MMNPRSASLLLSLFVLACSLALSACGDESPSNQVANDASASDTSGTDGDTTTQTDQNGGDQSSTDQSGDQSGTDQGNTDAADVNERPEDRSDELFMADRVMDIKIEIPEADWDVLRNQTRSFIDILGDDCLDSPVTSPFTYFRADVTVDGTRVNEVGLRKKGFLGSLSADKPSLKIKFDEYEGDQHLLGATRMTLNNARQDPGFINQCMAYAVFERAGVPAPRCSFARVELNGDDLGFYVHVDSIKKPFLRRFFEDDDGNLYEGALSDFRPGWTGTFVQKINEKSNPSQDDIQALVAALEDPDNIDLEEIDALVNLDAFFTFWATEVLIAHWDGYAGNTNNFYIFVDTTDGGRFHFLPWGADAVFRNNRDLFGGGEVPKAVMAQGVLAYALYNHPEGRARYFEAMTTVLEQAWDEEQLLADVDAMAALLLSDLSGDQLAAATQEVEKVKRFIQRRRAEIEGEMENPVEWPAELRDPPCIESIGTVSGTFETTWGTQGEDDLFSTGTGTIDLALNGITPVLDPIGAKGGPHEMNEGRSTFTMAGIRPEGDAIVVAFETNLSDVKPGTVPLDLSTGISVVLLFDPPTNSVTNLGYVFGELTFEEASRTNGDAIKASFSGQVYDLPFD